MKDMIKKLVEARFRGPTDDPSFADPGGSMEYDELSDRVTDMLDGVTKGEVANLQGKQLSYNDFGDGDGQYLLDGDVFANSYDEAERKILDMLDPRYNEQNNLGEQKMNLESLIEKLYESKSGMTLIENSRTEFIATVAAKVILNLTEGLDIEEQDDPVGMRDTKVSKLKGKTGIAKDLKNIATNISAKLSGSTPQEYNTIIKLFDKLATLSKAGGKFDSAIRLKLKQLFSLANDDLGVDDQDGNYLEDEADDKKSEKPSAGKPTDDALMNIGSRKIRDKLKARDAAPVTKLNRVPTSSRSKTRPGAPGARGKTQAMRSRNVGGGRLFGN